jgi:hypothetical protein
MNNSPSSVHDRQNSADTGARKRDLALLVALARGETVRDAAREAKLGERTAWRRMSDPEFRRRLSQIRADVMDRATGRLADAASDAARTLRALLDAESETVRLGAARAILELGTKLRETGELEERLLALEEGVTMDSVA